MTTGLETGRVRSSTNRATPRLHFVRLFRLNRWLTYLILVPAVAATTLLAISFFAVFIALFVALLLVVALRLWWSRRKPRDAKSVRLEDRCVVITDGPQPPKKTHMAETQYHRRQIKRYPDAGKSAQVKERR